MLIRFDAWLLERCQLFSDWLTKTIGLQEANYKIANVALVLSVVAGIAAAFAAQGVEYYMIILLVLSNMAIGAGEYFSELAADGNATTRKNPQQMRFPRLVQLYVFIIFLLLLIASLSMVGNTLIIQGQYLFLFLSGVFGLIFVYFVSCSHLPPTTSKVAQWLMKAFMKLVPVGSRR